MYLWVARVRPRKEPTNMKNSLVTLVLVEQRADMRQLAGWNESVALVERTGLSSYYHAERGEYAQAKTLSRAIGVAADSQTVKHPGDWPENEPGSASLLVRDLLFGWTEPKSVGGKVRPGCEFVQYEW